MKIKRTSILTGVLVVFLLALIPSVLLAGNQKDSYVTTIFNPAHITSEPTLLGDGDPNDINTPTIRGFFVDGEIFDHWNSPDYIYPHFKRKSALPGLAEGWATWSGEDSKIYPHEEFPFYFELPEYYHDKYIGVKLTIQTGWHRIDESREAYISEDIIPYEGD